MHVITLDKPEFEKACYELAEKLSSSSDVQALIGVRSGGAVVAKLVYQRLISKTIEPRYFEAGASRYATEVKNSGGVKNVFYYLPRFFLDWLRVIEHYIVTVRMQIFHDVNRSIKLDDGLVEYLTSLNEGSIFIIDDAIDSGSTINALLAEIVLINPALDYKVAVLVVTKKSPLVKPDVSIYQNVLLRFPWSGDYR
jgi:hypoxanthine phosphoribosyltransferase